MKRGFVFGKFLPFHLGHKALIEFGAEQCDELIVIVCASTTESIVVAIRSKWISETFKDNPKITVIDFQYDESILPNTSVSSKEVSRTWAREFSKLVPKVNMVFTSEPYGKYVAEFMQIEHLPYDEKRSDYKISGSNLRASLYDHWDFLPDSVKSYFQKKVVIQGTESVGKTTLATYLSVEFRSTLVTELGRDVIPDSKHLSKRQLEQIAEGHARNIDDACDLLAPVVIIDTDIHITQSYAMQTFGEYLSVPQAIYESNRANLYLYLNKEVAYIQDGTRLEEEARNKLDKSHRDTMNHFGIQLIELSGTYEERGIKSTKLIKQLVNSFN